VYIKAGVLTTQDLMKGYISHNLQKVVLGKTNPFPSLGSISR
jgi:hypothetical protein